MSSRASQNSILSKKLNSAVQERLSKSGGGSRKGDSLGGGDDDGSVRNGGGGKPKAAAAAGAVAVTASSPLPAAVKGVSMKGSPRFGGGKAGGPVAEGKKGGGSKGVQPTPPLLLPWHGPEGAHGPAAVAEGDERSGCSDASQRPSAGPPAVQAVPAVPAKGAMKGTRAKEAGAAAFAPRDSGGLLGFRGGGGPRPSGGLAHKGSGGFQSGPKPRRAGTGIRFAGVEDPSDEEEEEDRRSNGSGRRSNSGRPSGGAIGAGAGAGGGVRAPRDSFERGNDDGLAAAVDASVSVVTPMLLQPDGIVGPMVPADAASAMEMMDITEFAEFVSDMPWRERTYLVAQFRVRKVSTGGGGSGRGGELWGRVSPLSARTW